MLLNVDTGKFKLLDPGQLCGVANKYWMTDHRLVGALEAGRPAPWHTMRGSLYRLRLVVTVGDGNAAMNKNVSVIASSRAGPRANSGCAAAIGSRSARTFTIRHCSATTRPDGLRL